MVPLTAPVRLARPAPVPVSATPGAHSCAPLWTSPVCQDKKRCVSDNDCSLIFGSLVGKFSSPSPDGIRAHRLLYSYAAPKSLAALQVCRCRSNRLAIVYRLRNRRWVYTPVTCSADCTAQACPACARASIAHAWRAFLCAIATQAMLKPRRFSNARNQRLCSSCFVPRCCTTERAPWIISCRT